jgi:hypothetical protein
MITSFQHSRHGNSAGLQSSVCAWMRWQLHCVLVNCLQLADHNWYVLSLLEASHCKRRRFEEELKQTVELNSYAGPEACYVTRRRNQETNCWASIRDETCHLLKRTSECPWAEKVCTRTRETSTIKMIVCKKETGFPVVMLWQQCIVSPYFLVY